MPAATSPARIKTAERNARALELRKAGATLAQIAQQLGFNSIQAAHKAIRSELRKVPALEAQELRVLMAEQLQTLYAEALKVMVNPGPTVQHGRVVYQRDPSSGEILRDSAGRPVPLPDQGLRLQAWDRVLKAQESLRHLLGLDAPTRLRVESVPAEVVDGEIAALVDELGGPAAVARLEAALAADSWPAGQPQLP